MWKYCAAILQIYNHYYKNEVKYVIKWQLPIAKIILLDISVNVKVQYVYNKSVTTLFNDYCW